MPLGALKPKACKGCGQMFQPWSGFTKTCSPTCALKYTRDKADKLLAKQIRSEKMEMRARLMTRSDWLKKAKKALHAYIRARDIQAGYGCIDCGKPFEPNKPGGSVDAGHYRSVGAAKHMEFVEDNIHAQRKGCNRSGQNRHEAYRIGLIERIGLERVEALERDQTPRKHTIEDFKAMEIHYKAKLKELCKAIEK